MLRIGICDDNLNLQQKYQKMINEVMAKGSKKYEVTLFNDGDQVIEYLKQERNRLDILFLDILMERVGGLETAKRLREMKKDTLITFLTSSEEFIFDTMGLKPHDYLMKDQLTIEGLEKVLLEEIEIVEIKERERNKIMHLLGTNQFSFEDISYIKIHSNRWDVHLHEGSVYQLNKENEMKDLKEKTFYQIHPHYIIGLGYIQKIEKKQVILADENHTCLPIDEAYAKDLKSEFTEYMMRQL